MNYEFKGTLGPWMAVIEQATHDGRNIIRIHIYDETEGGQGQQVCSGYGDLSEHFPSLEQGSANAHLIAAAPDLLQLAITYLDDLKNLVPESEARNNRISQVEQIIEKALNL